MANNCKHIQCAICGGYKIKTAYVGTLKLNDLCSPKCQAAQKNICSCKCGGKYHKGQNSSELNKRLNPSKKKPVKRKKNKIVFEPQSYEDFVAEFMEGKRIKTQSFDRYSDRNYRKDNKKLTLNWLSQKGQPLDQLAADFISEYGLNQMDSDEALYRIVNYVNEYPAGLKSYIREQNEKQEQEFAFYEEMAKNAEIEQKNKAETINEDNYTEEELPEWLRVAGINKINMKLKKGSQQAKAFMAKLRAKRNMGAIKILEKGESKSAKPKAVYMQKRTSNGTFKGLKQIGAKPGYHKDTKAHNVNIRVVSGFTKKISGLFDISIIEDIDKLKKEYFRLAKIYHPDAGGTDAQFQQLQAEYEKHLKTLLSGSKLTDEQKATEIELDAALRDAVSALIGLPGIDIELVYKWLWVTGNTYPIRVELKNAGFQFAPKKKAWYFKGVESRGRGKQTLEEIKSKYGAMKIMPKPDKNKKIEGIGSINKTSKRKFGAAIKRAAKALNKRIV